MIKAVGKTPEGKTLLLIGLSRENCRKLLKKQPIVFDAGELDIPGLHVSIVGGNTEADIARELRQFGLINANTRIVGREQ